jgi:alpha-L-fucosidase
MKHLFILFFSGLSLCGQAQLSLTKLSEEFVFIDPPFEQCHASTLVETAPNKLMVSFFGGSQEGSKDVAIWLVKQQYSKKWSRPYRIAEGIKNDSVRYPCWNPVLFKAKGGKLFLFYKVGPNPREWWGMLRTSTNKGKKWCTGYKLPAGILGPVKNKPMQLPDGTILSPSSVELSENRWTVHIEKSADLGKTWQSIPIDTACTFKVIEPSILGYNQHKLQILCRSNQNRLVEAWSPDDGNTWSRLDTTPVLNPNSGADAVTLSSGWQLLVYNPATQGKEQHDNRGKLSVAASKDGRAWKEVVQLEAGDSTNEFSYPAVIQTQDGNIHITYTFNRKNIKHVVLQETGLRQAMARVSTGQ